MQLQTPTITHMRIRSVNDAHKLFHAVYQGMLPMVVRRLDAEERKMIKSGDVHVWEERGPGTEMTGLGIERWTDGRLWGPSRVRDCFLFYHEKEREPEDYHGGSKWAKMLSGGVVVFKGQPSRMDEVPSPYDGQPGHPNALGVMGVPPSSDLPSIGTFDSTQFRYDGSKDRLVKQTYSVLVHFPDQQPESVRKWHMTAYFSVSTRAQEGLRTVDDCPAIAALQPPEGMYEPARAGRNGGRGRSGSSASAKSVQIPPIPASMQTPTPNGVSLRPVQTPPGGYAQDDQVHALSRSSPLRSRSYSLNSYPPPHSHAVSSGYPTPPLGEERLPFFHAHPHRFTPYHRSPPVSPSLGSAYDRESAPQLPRPGDLARDGYRDTAVPSPTTGSFPYSSNSTPSGSHTLLPPLVNDARSRSSSMSSTSVGQPDSASVPVTPPSHPHLTLHPPHPPSHVTGLGAGREGLLVPLSFLENNKRSLESTPTSWTSQRRAVDEEALRNLELRK